MSASQHWELVLIGAVLVVTAGAVVTSSYVLGVLVFIALNAIAALGLSLVMGFAGQVSLGQAAFYAIGAYVSGVLTASYGWNGWVALAVAVLPYPGRKIGGHTGVEHAVVAVGHQVNPSPLGHAPVSLHARAPALLGDVQHGRTRSRLSPG